LLNVVVKIVKFITYLSPVTTVDKVLHFYIAVHLKHVK